MSLLFVCCVPPTAICYDKENNIIWSCSNDWVDEYLNPGTMATHLILHRLGMRDREASPQQQAPSSPLSGIPHLHGALSSRPPAHLSLVYLTHTGPTAAGPQLTSLWYTSLTRGSQQQAPSSPLSGIPHSHRAHSSRPPAHLSLVYLTYTGPTAAGPQHTSSLWYTSLTRGSQQQAPSSPLSGIPHSHGAHSSRPPAHLSLVYLTHTGLTAAVLQHTSLRYTSLTQ